VTLKVRRAGTEDVETLVEIQRESAVAAFAHVFPPERYPFPTDAIRHGWAEAVADPDVEAYLADIDGDPVASVSIGQGFLRTLYTVPGHWGRGIGSTLLEHGLA
jgi:GNAT superfamily N-acetyltransferase